MSLVNALLYAKGVDLLSRAANSPGILWGVIIIICRG
jgi:hypothetical protein